MGAALMYMFDPSGGRRRRALTRDQVVRAARAAGESLDATARDWSNRAAGTAAEVRSRLRSDRPDDHILVERVRTAEDF